MPEPRYPLTADLAGVLAAAAQEQVQARRPASEPSLQANTPVLEFIRTLVRRAFAWRPARAGSSVARARSA
jgi:hypothetical protein